MSVQIPGYVIHRELGSGGMAKVFLATQTSLDRQVALKIMSPALAADPTFAKRFQREARTIASLAHPNIAAVYEVGSIQHLHFFAMQYLSGGDLAGRLRKGISEAELARIVVGIAKALGFAHSKGIVHRDVTPGNVLFDQADHPILTDFGIARAQQGGTKITHTGVSIGTSSYMSPEQARGGEVDARSDLYSLGALLFEALSGRPPYQGVDGFAVAYAHVFEPIPRLPQPLQHWQGLIDRVMSKAPEDRYANAEEFIAAIQAVGASESRPVPWREGASLPAAATAAPVPRTDPELKTQAMLVPAPEPPKRASVLAVPSQPPKASAAKPRPASAAAVVAKRSPLPLAFWLVSGGALLGLVVALFVTDGFGLWRNAPITIAPSLPGAAVTSGSPPPRVTAADSVSSDGASTSTSLTATAANAGADSGLSPAGSETPLEGGGVDADVAAEDATSAPVVEVLSFDPANPRSFTGPPARSEFVKRFFFAAEQAKKDGRLTEPRNNNVLDLMAIARRVDPSNPEINKRVLEVAALLQERANQKYEEKLLAEVKPLLDKAIEVARSVNPKDANATAWEAQRLVWVKDRLTAAGQAELDWRTKAAEALYKEVLDLLPEHPPALDGIKRTAGIGKPGYRFRVAMKSGGQSPYLRVIAPGAVVLRDDRNGSARVEVEQAFAMAEREVTREDYERFAVATRRAAPSKGCNDREGFAMFTSKDRTWKNPGFEQSSAHPVTCVSHRDALDYTKWLSQQTGRNFRLPSEPEWRLAAGNLGPGDCGKGNIGDQSFATTLKGRDVVNCSDGHAGTAPVQAFPAGPNQLFDMAGNVREWVADCFVRSVGARTGGGGPYQRSGCDDYLALGTAWISGTDERNAQPRQGFSVDALNNTVGFRVAMDLPSSNL